VDASPNIEHASTPSSTEFVPPEASRCSAASGDAAWGSLETTLLILTVPQLRL